MTLYKLSIALTPSKYGINIYEIGDLKETPATYSKKGTRIDKSKILVANSTWILNQPHYMQFCTFCLPEDKDKAIEILKDKVAKEYLVSREIFYKVINNFEDGCKVDDEAKKATHL